MDGRHTLLTHRRGCFLRGAAADETSCISRQWQTTAQSLAPQRY